MKSKIIILIFTIFVFCACKFNSVDNGYVKISDIKNYKTFDGYVKSRNGMRLSFQNDGKISFLPYKKGDYIKKGEILARLDNVLYKIKKEKFNLDDEFNYNILTAPYDGYIEEIYKPLNSYVKKGQPIMTLYPKNKTEAEILVEPEYINKINLKKNGVLEYKNTNYEAKISNITKSDDNYLIELELNDVYKELKEGVNIKVLLNLN